MNIVDKLYDLIKKDNSINTLNTNKDLFIKFYYNFMNIEYYGFKVIDIYKYLLSLNLDDNNELLPYINSKIIADFNKYEQFITQNVYFNNFTCDDNYIKLIESLIENYYYFSKYRDNSKLDKLISELNFIRDYTASMMIILNSSFFSISNENIHKLVNYIRNNEYIKNICEFGLKKGLLDKDYIFQYISRYLFTEVFINYNNLDNDYLLNKLINGEIKDKLLFEKIIKNMNFRYLIVIFDKSLTKFINVLDKVSDDPLFKINLFKYMFNLLVKNELYTILLDFIIKDNRYKEYLNDKDINYIINLIVLKYPTDLTDEEVIFLINNTDNKFLKLNIKENLKNNNWSNDTIKLIEEKTKTINNCDISYEEAINTLDDMFKGKKITIPSSFSCLKAIIRYILNDSNFKVYLGSFSDYGYSTETDSICLNIKFIKQLIDTNNYEDNPELIHILVTLFHEVNHIIQFRKMNDSDMDDITYHQFKEEIIRKIISGYYFSNYKYISIEQEARINGSYTLVKFLKKYFPYLTNCIKYYENITKVEQIELDNKKKVFELSNKVDINLLFDKLVSLFPSILEDYPILNREYNKDGSRCDIIKV